MRTAKGYSEEGSSSACTRPDTCLHKPTDSRERERERPIPTQVSTYSSLCIPLNRRFIMQTLPFPKIHIETIFGQTQETKWSSCAVMGVWSSGRGCKESSKCISSLASGALKRWAGRVGDVGRHTRVKDCQKRNKKEADMIKKLPLPPCLSVCTCLLSGTRPSKGLNPESVNSYKHTPMYMSTHILTHSYSCISSKHTHSHAYVSPQLWHHSLARMDAD